MKELQEQNYKVNRRSSHKNVQILKLPENVVSTMNNKNRKAKFKEEFAQCIKIFRNTVKTQMPHVNLDIFCKNIQTLKIKEKKKFVLYISCYAFYYLNKNKIIVIKDDYLKSVFHELFHVSSSLVIGNVIFSGFKQTRGKNGIIYKIGDGLNEGYTALLTERYFKYFRKDSYILQKHISQKLEVIIGKEKMEQLYFNADLYGLVEEFKKYESEENIVHFLRVLDCFDECLFAPCLYNKEFLEEISQEIFSFLTRVYTTKMFKLFKNKSIDEDRMINNICSYVGGFYKDFSPYGHDYKCFETSKLLENISGILHIPKERIKILN